MATQGTVSSSGVQKQEFHISHGMGVKQCPADQN